MAKRELRLAVVIYGGASLAVYMHGVTKELLKLARASKVLHEPGWEAQHGRFADSPDQRTFDTEAIYFELLRKLNEHTHTRVVIDVVAGASAGAINGVLLAKGLVDDASLDAITELWLTGADADELRGEQVSRARKWYLSPLLRALSLWLPNTISSNEEIRGKLTRLVRTSWFRPPFSGAKLCRRLLNALEDMQRSRRSGSTLLPREQRLDVYASITDLFGYPRLIHVHDRLVARETEHAAFCRLSHVPSGARAFSDFTERNAPALVWAARASSSYAGAFAPFRHAELMQVLAERRQDWPAERRFLQRSVFDAVGQPASASLDPATRTYVDGGIVNNKPFGAALEALQHRPADRRVERVMLYVEPDPNVDEAGSSDRALGYLGTIRAAASTIPRNEPILADLETIMAQARRARTNRRIIESQRPQIHERMAGLLPQGSLAEFSTEAFGAARKTARDRVCSELGLAYAAYISRRHWRLVEALAEEWAVLTQGMDQQQQRKDMLASIQAAEALAQQQEAASAGGSADSAERGTRQPGHATTSAMERFLGRFDLSYRIRRVQFLIRRLNRTHGHAGLTEELQVAFSDYKRKAYAVLEDLQTLRSARALRAPLARALIKAAEALPLNDRTALDLLDALAGALDLESFDRRIDSLFSELCRAAPDVPLLREQLLENLSFVFYDVLLMPPGAEEGGPDPLTDLRVERVSPADAPSLAAAFSGLKCRNFMGFLGFFNRSYREHDYLWGRLHAAERIIDLLWALDEGNGARVFEPAAKATTLKELASAVIATERQRLGTLGDDFERLETLLSGQSLDPSRSDVADTTTGSEAGSEAGSEIGSGTRTEPAQQGT
ncbi:MAG: patatin-like protein [Pseudomonadota bacterium]